MIKGAIKNKRQTKGWKKIFATRIFTKDLYLEYIFKVSNLNSKKTNNSKMNKRLDQRGSFQCKEWTLKKARFLGGLREPTTENYAKPVLRGTENSPLSLRAYRSLLLSAGLFNSPDSLLSFACISASTGHVPPPPPNSSSSWSTWPSCFRTYHILAAVSLTFQFQTLGKEINCLSPTF